MVVRCSAHYGALIGACRAGNRKIVLRVCSPHHARQPRLSGRQGGQYSVVISLFAFAERIYEPTQVATEHCLLTRLLTLTTDH